jgi:hypothetical protein
MATLAGGADKVTSHHVLQAFGQGDALAKEMAEVLAHADVGRAGERALLALRALLPDGASRQCLDPLIAAAAAVPDGPGARIRGRLRLLPCGLPLARLQQRLRRWRGPLPTGW